MDTTDCPFCGGQADTDAGLLHLDCDGCGVTVEVAPDPTPARELERAA